jgi:uncharacterized protein (UPF0332 family)
MAIPPEAFHSVAKSLVEYTLPPKGESMYRTVVGRAYYSAFLATCAALRTTHGMPFDHRLDHELVCNTLAAHVSDPEVKKLGTMLNTLRHMRIDADYKLKLTVLEDDADTAVLDAAVVLKLLPTIAGQLPRVE